MAGKTSMAVRVLEPLEVKADLDSNSLYNIGCFFVRIGQDSKALQMLKRSLRSGFAETELFRTDPDLDPLRERDDFKALMKELEERNHA